MTEQRLGCEEQMKPAAPSVVESGGAEAVKQQLEATDPIVAATLNFLFWSIIIVMIVIAVE